MLYLSLAAFALAPQPAAAPPRLPTTAEMRATMPKPTPPMAGDPATVATIKDLEHRWGQAFVTRDFAFLERIIAPEFRLSSTAQKGDNTITGRVDWMRNSRAFDHKGFVDEVIDVMTAGDTAVAMVRTAWTVQRVSDRPAATTYGLCADTWLRRRGQWQVVYRNCNRQPAPLAAPKPAGAQ